MKLIEKSLNASYNLQKVDWKDFDEHLQKTKDKIIIKMQRIISLEAKVIYLIECIKNTMNVMIKFTQWIDEIYKSDMTMWYFKQTQNEYIL